MHDIEAANNKNLVSSLITYDILGFFNNVSHNILLHKLCNMHMPLPIVKWTQSFLLDQRTTICLDGQQDEMKEIRTGIPQGLCISPILACCMTPKLGESILDAIKSERLTNDELDEELKQEKAVVSRPPYMLTMVVSLFIQDLFKQM